MDDMSAFKTLEPSVDQFIRIVGSGIEIFGVLIIVIGIAWSTYRQLKQPIADQDSDLYKIRIGRSLLLGLEVLVACYGRAAGRNFHSARTEPANTLPFRS